MLDPHGQLGDARVRRIRAARGGVTFAHRGAGGGVV
jgi:hypothetical protein